MISYEPLLKTLKKRNMKRSDLRAYMSSSTVAKISNNEFLSLKTIHTMCEILHCQIEDIVMYVNEDEQTEKTDNLA